MGYCMVGNEQFAALCDELYVLQRPPTNQMIHLFLVEGKIKFRINLQASAIFVNFNLIVIFVENFSYLMLLS